MDNNSKQLSVLVVEDEELLLNAITRKLELHGLKVIQAKSGKDAVDLIDKLETPPQAIWLDYYLKDMSGLEFMAALKRNGKWSHIPTIVVSNSASPDKVTNMLTLGVKKYYLKAENRLDDIIASIRDLIIEENSLYANQPRNQ